MQKTRIKISEPYAKIYCRLVTRILNTHNPMVYIEADQRFDPWE
jgi:hypothetical protein